MAMTGKTDVFGEKLVLVLPVHHKSYTGQSGIEPKRLR